MIKALLVTLMALQTGPHWDRIGEARKSAALCSINAGVQLDDKITSPEIIIRGAAGICNRQMMELDAAIRANAAIELRNVPLAEHEPLVADFIASMRKQVEDMTIQAILEQRSKK